MQPKISTRCSSCGAAVRDPAMFCPECGKPLTPVASPTELSATAEEPAQPVADTKAEGVADQKVQTPPAPAVAAESERAPNKSDKTAEPEAPHSARERTKERLHRASSVARGAFEDNVKRVEKIHHVSTAMIEEAHYDSSLRFVLVALGLFVIFIVLLILSKVMG
jgi:predicted  nucleic acid-binding Zn-ribbon protein